jgi:hypothetical protein
VRTDAYGFFNATEITGLALHARQLIVESDILVNLTFRLFL